MVCTDHEANIHNYYCIDNRIHMTFYVLIVPSRTNFLAAKFFLHLRFHGKLHSNF